MSSIVKFEMKGLDELDRAVKKLPEKIQKRVLIGALRAGGRVIQKEAKARAPVKSGNLKRNISVVAGKSKKSAPIGQVQAEVFVATTPKAWYSHLIEFGTKHISAKPFLRPAFDTTHQEVLNAIGDKLAEGILKETAKL